MDQPHGAASNATRILFDFDLTLTRWDTADRFFRWLLRRSPWRLACVACCAPVLAPLMLFRATRKWPVRFAVWVATLGRTDAELHALIDAHVASLPEPAFAPAALARLQHHLDQQHRVAIATGCLTPLAAALLRGAGYGHVPLVASTYRFAFGGIVVDRHCFGPNKIPMLEERGFGPPWHVAYTDHHADLPVLRLSDTCYLIDPKPRCHAMILEALAVTPTVLPWRSS